MSPLSFIKQGKSFNLLELNFFLIFRISPRVARGEHGHSPAW